MPYDDDEFAQLMAGESPYQGGQFGGTGAGASFEPQARLLPGAQREDLSIEEQLQEPFDPSWAGANERWKRNVIEPAQAWWEYQPREEKFMDVVRTATDFINPQKGATPGMASVFGIGEKKAFQQMQQAARAQKSLQEELEREALKRSGAARWLGKARTSTMKKGTPLGDTMRKVGYAPGAESTVKLKSPKGDLARATAGAADINLPLRGGEDPMTIAHVLGHEMGHPQWRRMQRLAELGDPEALEVVNALEQAMAAAPKFRHPGDVMPAAIEVTEQRARSIPEALESGIARAIPIDRPHGPDPFGERIADFLSTLTTHKGQQELTKRQREILAPIMDFY